MNDPMSAVTLTDYIPEQQEDKRAILADLAMFVPAPASGSTRPRPSGVP